MPSPRTHCLSEEDLLSVEALLETYSRWDDPQIAARQDQHLAAWRAGRLAAPTLAYLARVLDDLLRQFGAEVEPDTQEAMLALRARLLEELAVRTELERIRHVLAS